MKIFEPNDSYFWAGVMICKYTMYILFNHRWEEIRTTLGTEWNRTHPDRYPFDNQGSATKGGWIWNFSWLDLSFFLWVNQIGIWVAFVFGWSSMELRQLWRSRLHRENLTTQVPRCLDSADLLGLNEFRKRVLMTHDDSSLAISFVMVWFVMTFWSWGHRGIHVWG